jgi:hypothetical protein
MPSLSLGGQAEVMRLMCSSGEESNPNEALFKDNLQDLNMQYLALLFNQEH